LKSPVGGGLLIGVVEAEALALLEPHPFFFSLAQAPHDER